MKTKLENKVSGVRCEVPGDHTQKKVSGVRCQVSGGKSRVRSAKNKDVPSRNVFENNVDNPEARGRKSEVRRGTIDSGS